MDMNNLHIYSEPLFPSSESQLFPSSPSASPYHRRFNHLLNLSGETGGDGSIDKTLSGELFQQDDDGDDEEGEVAAEGSPQDGSQEEMEFDLERAAVRASDLYQEYLTTGCHHLDKVLKGGIPTFGITELYGEGGSGKTQLCLQLAITAQLLKKDGGLDSGVLYICTEDAFPSKRLNELIFYWKKRIPGGLPDAPMNHVFVEHIADPDTLMECLDVKLEALARLSSKKIRLVILDSVAGIFRTEFDDFKKRTMGLRQLGQTLHEFSLNHKASIVICNQVTANLQAGGNIAALGMTWKNMVTTRIRMSKSENHLYRCLEACFSPHAPSVRTSFQVAAEGIQGLAS